jgi:hypothetical protein
MADYGLHTVMHPTQLRDTRANKVKAETSHRQIQSLLLDLPYRKAQAFRLTVHLFNIGNLWSYG